MNNFFLAMLTGHLIADFWLQPTSWVTCKQQNGWKSKKLILHALIAAVTPVIFTLKPEFWWFIPVIFISHYLIDVVKSKIKMTIIYFLIDQLLHISVLALLVLFFKKTELNSQLSAFWIYTCGLILVTNPLGILTGMFLKSATQTEILPAKTDVSAWIGILERILIVIFVTMDQFEAIGFLVAAKSVFRFNETKKDGNKKAEYFLLGTLVSFTLAIGIGLGIGFLIKG